MLQIFRNEDVFKAIIKFLLSHDSGLTTNINFPNNFLITYIPAWLRKKAEIKNPSFHLP